MKKVLSYVFFVFVLILLFSCTSAEAAYTADDFIRQSPASVSSETEKDELRKVQQPDKVKEIPASKDSATISPTISAQDVRDAINALVANRNEGAWRIEFPEGEGAVAIGVAVYDKFENNPVAARISKRHAFTEAYLAAKNNLTIWTEGQMTAYKAFISENVQTASNENENLSNILTRAEESIKMGVDGFVRNHTIYDVFEDADNRIVYVAIVTAPALWDGTSLPGKCTILAGSSRNGLNRALAEINNNIAFPIGGVRIFVPDTGEIIFVGYGSAVVGYSENEAAQTRLNLAATRMARMRAGTSLFNIISERERLQGKMQLEDNLARAIGNLEKLSSDDLTEKVDDAGYEKLAPLRDIFQNSTEYKAILSAENEGNLPPKVDSRSWLDEKKEWAYAVAVYSYRANPQN